MNDSIIAMRKLYLVILKKKEMRNSKAVLLVPLFMQRLDTFDVEPVFFNNFQIGDKMWCRAAG